jgi:Fe(3+) dicitrate transport protein
VTIHASLPIPRSAVLALVAGLLAAPRARADHEAPWVPSARDPSAPVGKPGEPEPSAVPPLADASPPAPSAAPPPPVTEVTVAGTRLSRLPGSVHVITKKQLERLEYDDAHAVLQKVPGVYVGQEDGIGLRPNIGLRGGNPDRSKKLTLMEDGVLFGPAPYTAPAAYYFPLMTRMTSIRVVKGPSAIAFGPQTVGGAVDLISRPIPDKTSGGVDLAFGQYGYSKLHAFAGTSDERAGFLLEGVRLGGGGFKTLPNGGDTGSTRHDVMGKVSYVVDPRAVDRHELGVKLSYADEVSNETYLGLSDADFRADPYQRYAASALDRMQNHRLSAVATHRFETPASSLKLTTTAYRHEYTRVWRKLNDLGGAGIAGVLRDPDDPANVAYADVLRGRVDSSNAAERLWIGPNDRAFVSQGVQQVLSFEKTVGPVSQRFELGFRLHQDRIERRHSERAFLMMGGQLVPESLPEAVVAANDEESTALALHVIDTVSVGRLTLTPGVRVELIRATSDNFLKNTYFGALTRAVMPGAGAHYGLTEELGVLAGVYRGFSPPPPPAPVPGDPNPNPQAADHEPEYSVNYEGGLRYQSGPQRAEVIGFYNDYTNMTDSCSLASGCDAENLDRHFSAGAARVYGMEVYAAHDVALPLGLTLPVLASYTLTRANFESTFSSLDPIYGDVRAGDEVPYVPRHQVAVTAGVEHARASGTVAVTYVSAMREEAGSAPLERSLATDEQLLVDASASVRIVSGLALYANLRNVLGGAFIVSRRPYGARPNAPRWLQMGAKLAF